MIPTAKTNPTPEQTGSVIGPPKKLLSDLHSKWAKPWISATSTMDRTDSKLVFEPSFSKIGPVWEIIASPATIAGDDHDEIEPETLKREGTPQKLNPKTRSASELHQAIDAVLVSDEQDKKPLTSILKARSLTESPSSKGSRVSFSKERTVIRFVPYLSRSKQPKF